MKSIKQTVLSLSIIVFLSSCATSMNITYSESSENKNSFIIKPSIPLANTSVVVNDKLVIDKKHIKDVKITGLPDGKNNIQITSSSLSYSENVSEKIEVSLYNGEEKTELIKAPSTSKGYWTYMTVTSIGTIALLLVLL